MPGPDTGGCKTGKRRRRPQTECAKEILLSYSFHPAGCFVFDPLIGARLGCDRPAAPPPLSGRVGVGGSEVVAMLCRLFTTPTPTPPHKGEGRSSRRCYGVSQRLCPCPSAASGEGKLRPVAKSKRLFRGGALGLDSLAVSRHPAPGARPVAALGDALLVNVRDLLAVAGEQ